MSPWEGGGSAVREVLSKWKEEGATHLNCGRLETHQSRAKKLKVKFSISHQIRGYIPKGGVNYRNFLISRGDTKNIRVCGLFPWA